MRLKVVDGWARGHDASMLQGSQNSLNITGGVSARPMVRLIAKGVFSDSSDIALRCSFFNVSKFLVWIS